MARTGALCECGGCRRFKAAKRRFKQHCESNDAVCWLCGGPIDYKAPPDMADAFNLDHRIPRSQRPDLTEDPGNWSPSHASCNKSRKDSAPTTLGTTSRAW